jgi:four helix bundle protein
MCFEELEIWQLARAFVKDVYALTRKGDLAKDYGLKDQIQRAAVSVMTNTAEGFERTGIQETQNFYNIARASCGECRSLLYVIEDNYTDLAGEAACLRSRCIPIGIKLTRLIQSTQTRTP